MEIKTFSYSTLLNLWHLIVFHFASLLCVRGKSINSHREWKYVELVEGRCECVVDWCYCFVWKHTLDV